MSDADDTSDIEALSLGLLGSGPLDAGQLADSLTWQRGDAVLVGRQAVLAAIARAPKRAVKIEEIVAQGRAASVTGRLIHDGGASLFCQMIKFANGSSRQVTSIVSFEHALGPRG